MSTEIKRGDIFYCNFGNGKGSEQFGLRPCVVVQNDIGNKYAPTTIVVPLTSRVKKIMPTHVLIKTAENEGCFLPHDSVFLGEQIRTIDKGRLERRIGKLGGVTMLKIQLALNVSLGL